MPESKLPADRLLKLLPIVLAVVLILSVAVVQGIWSDRWTDSASDARVLAERVAQVPLTIGEWDGEDLPADTGQLKASGAVGHISRSYVNRITGERVTLFLICGHMRDVSVHTPDRCYPAAGFKQLGETVPYTIELGSTSADFFTTRFRLEAPEGILHQRVFWTWGHDDRWQAPEWPRGEFRGVRALYKLYLVTMLPPDSQPPVEESPCLAFGKVMLPELSRLLFDQAPASSVAVR